MPVGYMMGVQFFIVAADYTLISVSFQNASTECPLGARAPRPVMTTRRFSTEGHLRIGFGSQRMDVRNRPKDRGRRPSTGDPRAPLLPLLKVLDRFPNGRDLLGILVGDLQIELLLEGHHELDRVQ